jgi:hypothetical protein
LSICSKEQMRGVIRFLFAEGFKTVKIIRRIQAQYGDNCWFRSKIYEWIHQFKEGRTSVCDEERSERPSTSRTEDNVQAFERIVCSKFSRGGWSIVRSASLAKGGTSKKRPSPHLHKVPTRNNKVSPWNFQTALVFSLRIRPTPGSFLTPFNHLWLPHRDGTLLSNLPTGCNTDYQVICACLLSSKRLWQHLTHLTTVTSNTLCVWNANI